MGNSVARDDSVLRNKSKQEAWVDAIGTKMKV